MSWSRNSKKHIRLIQEREKNLPVENDLRGLGNTSLFQDLKPEPILSIKGQGHSECKIFADLNLVIEPADKGHDTHITCGRRDLSHKEKTLSLFAFALYLKVQKNSSSRLWEKRPFHEELCRALTEQTLSQTDEVKDVSVDVACQIYLRQAGFDFPEREQDLVLNDSKVRELWNNWANENSQILKKAV